MPIPTKMVTVTLTAAATGDAMATVGVAPGAAVVAGAGAGVSAGGTVACGVAPQAAKTVPAVAAAESRRKPRRFCLPTFTAFLLTILRAGSPTNSTCPSRRQAQGRGWEYLGPAFEALMDQAG